MTVRAWCSSYLDVVLRRDDCGDPRSSIFSAACVQRVRLAWYSTSQQEHVRSVARHNNVHSVVQLSVMSLSMVQSAMGVWKVLVVVVLVQLVRNTQCKMMKALRTRQHVQLYSTVDP